MTIASPILLSHRKLNISKFPFPHFGIPNYFDADLYRALDRSFPDLSLFGYEREGGNLLITDEVADNFVTGNPIWRDVFDRLSERSFIQDAINTIGRMTFIRARGALGGLPLIPPFGGREFGSCVEFNYKFSRMGRETHLFAHTDQPSTVFTFMLYFPTDDWKNEYGGSTAVCLPRDRKLTGNWSNHHLPIEDVEVIKESGYRANYLFGFVKSSASWHSVMPIQGPSNISRRALIITYHIRPEDRDSVLYRGANYVYRHLEKSRFST